MDQNIAFDSVSKWLITQSVRLDAPSFSLSSCGWKFDPPKLFGIYFFLSCPSSSQLAVSSIDPRAHNSSVGIQIVDDSLHPVRISAFRTTPLWIDTPTRMSIFTYDPIKPIAILYPGFLGFASSAFAPLGWVPRRLGKWGGMGGGKIRVRVFVSFPI